MYKMTKEKPEDLALQETCATSRLSATDVIFTFFKFPFLTVAVN